MQTRKAFIVASGNSAIDTRITAYKPQTDHQKQTDAEYIKRHRKAPKRGKYEAVTGQKARETIPGLAESRNFKK